MSHLCLSDSLQAANHAAQWRRRPKSGNNKHNMGGHGGARTGAGKKSNREKAASAPGQQTLFGAVKNLKQKAPPMTVEESRRRQEEEEKQEQQRQESQQEREANAQILEEEKRKKREQDERDAIAKLRRLAEDAENYSRQYSTDDDDPEDFSDDEEDEDYDDDDEDDDGNDDDAENFDRRAFTPGRKRQKTKPPKDSALDKYLSNMKERIISRSDLQDGRQWFPSNYDPLSTKNSARAPDPNEWCQAKHWEYYFDPAKQNRHLIGDHIEKQCYCTRCGKQGTLERHQYSWHMFHWFEKEVLCLHPRMRKTNAVATFPTAKG